MKKYIEIWNEAYNEYAENGIEGLKEYMQGVVDSGNLSDGDANTMMADIVETYNL